MKMINKSIKKLIIKMINNNHYEKNKKKYNKASLLTKLLSKKWCLKFIYISIKLFVYYFLKIIIIKFQNIINFYKN